MDEWLPLPPPPPPPDALRSTALRIYGTVKTPRMFVVTVSMSAG